MPLSSKQRHAMVGSARYWRLKREFQYNFLIHAGLEPFHRLLDYGCGTLRGGIPLIEFLNAGNYTGVDVREEVIHEASRELQASGVADKAPLLDVIEHPEATPPGPFDVIWMFDLVIHLDDEIADTVFAMCRSRVAPGGVVYFNANAVWDTVLDMTWREFPVVFRTPGFYRDLADRHEMLIESMGSLLSLGHDNGDYLQNTQTMFAMRPNETI